MKTLRTILLLLFTWIIWLLISQYFFCARFRFDDPIPFEGDAIFNPYDAIGATDWVKCNFHAHASAWNGITNGHGTASDVHKAYRSLNYGIHCVSNYHYIDTTNVAQDSYIPAYEHGFNMNKTHQLVLGSQQVQWLDYVFGQSIHNKQHVLKNLYDPGSVVILNHPALRNGYKPEDFSQLTNYDCMEVLNPSVVSTAAWDAALSAGKRVFIVGNDDIHNVIAKERLGRMCTYVNAKSNNGKEVMRALKTGKSYGVIIGENQKITEIPMLISLKVKGDTMVAKVTQSADEVTITGQDGRELAKYHHTAAISYRLKKDDHYARVTFKYSNGTSIFLNPVFFTPPSGYQETMVYESVNETRFFRTLGIVILFLWVLLLWQSLPGNRSQRYGRRRLSLR